MRITYMVMQFLSSVQKTDSHGHILKSFIQVNTAAIVQKDLS